MFEPTHFRRRDNLKAMVLAECADGLLFTVEWKDASGKHKNTLVRPVDKFIAEYQVL